MDEDEINDDERKIEGEAEVRDESIEESEEDGEGEEAEAEVRDESMEESEEDGEGEEAEAEVRDESIEESEEEDASLEGKVTSAVPSSSPIPPMAVISPFEVPGEGAEDKKDMESAPESPEPKSPTKEQLPSEQENPALPGITAGEGEGSEEVPETPAGPYIGIVALSKAGSVTIPKDIRETLKLDPSKKLKFTWDRENKLLFEIVPDNEIIEIEQAIEAEKEKKTKKVEKKAKKGKISGPEFEFPKYMGYDFEDSNKLQPILEKSFKQFKHEPPNIDEGLKYVKHALLSLTGENNITNAKLRFTIGNFICDVVEKFNLPLMLDFLQENIIKDIKSKVSLRAESRPTRGHDVPETA